jgi:arylsulfatase A-like enzyme
MNNEEIDGAGSTTFTAQLSGDYQLRAEDSYTCIRQSNAIGVTATTVFSSSARPNVVLFITDDNSFDSWSPNGGPAFFSDPNVSALAEEGANFSTAYAVFSFCVPSRATMLTGLYPHLNGATCNNECNFKQTLPTVATILHDGGYYTAQVGKYHLTSEPQIGYDFWMASEKFKYENNTYNYNGTPKQIPGHLTDVITDTAVALIGRIDQPLFLLVEHFAPHIMYDVQDRFDTLYAHAPIDLPVAFD